MGTGGSRNGAGRPGRRRRCESKLKLDIRVLARRGDLRPSSFGLEWTREGERTGEIGVRIHEGSCFATLSYIRTLDGEQEQISDCFVIEYTPCNYGGQRPWFVCKWCRDRCAILYGISRDGHFGCRHCLRLGYASESESVIDRTWRKQRKLEARLERNGIRARTTERLNALIDECEDKRDIAFAPQFARLLARLDPEFDAALRDEMSRAAGS